MRSRIYETVERLSVRTSVCLSYRSTAETADLLLSAREELLIDSGRQCSAATAPQHKEQQMRAVS